MTAVLIAVILAGIAAVGLGSTAAAGRGGVDAALQACASSSTGHVESPPAAVAVGPVDPPVSPTPAEAVPALLGLVNETNWTTSAFFCYDWVVAFPAPGLTFGNTELRVYTALCGSVPDEYGISYLNAGGTPIESENLTSLQWSPSPSGPLLSGDSLLVSATGPLGQDQLDTNVSGWAEGSVWGEKTGMMILPYSGESEGPCL